MPLDNAEDTFAREHLSSVRKADDRLRITGQLIGARIRYAFTVCSAFGVASNTRERLWSVDDFIFATEEPALSLRSLTACPAAPP